jgi:hypothetical protein
VAFRKKIYTSLEQLQTDLDAWLKEDNEERTHSGKYCYGKTPLQNFQEAKPLVREKMLHTWLEASDSLTAILPSVS